MNPIRPLLQSVRGKFVGMFCLLASLTVSGFAFAQEPDETTVPSTRGSSNGSSTKASTVGSTTVNSKSINSKTVTGRKFPGSKFNLHVLATEKFVNSLLARTDSDSGMVNDFVLGASVKGWQSTNTLLTVDFKPNRQYGQMDFRLTGNTQSQTVGTTSQAVVDTLGQHTFLSTKPVFFDGRRLLTRKAVTTVNARNTNQGVVTAYSGLPILGDIADRTARDRIASSRPQTERIAAAKVVQRVNPRFNGELDRQLYDTNLQIKNLIEKWLVPQKLQPNHTFATTSEDYLRYSASIKQAGWPVDTAIPSDRPHGNALSIYIHESLFEQIAYRMDLNGLEVSDRTLQSMIRKMGGTVTDPAAEAGEGEDNGAASLFSLLFDKDKPVSVDAQDGQLKLNLRFAVKPNVTHLLAGMSDSSERDGVVADADAFPMHDLTIPLTMAREKQTLAINPGPVTVMAAKVPESEEESEDSGGGFAGMFGFGGGKSGGASAMTTKLIENYLQSKLKSIELPDTFELPLSSGQKVKLRISKAESKNGWLMLALDRI